MPLFCSLSLRLQRVFILHASQIVEHPSMSGKRAPIRVHTIARVYAIATRSMLSVHPGPAKGIVSVDEVGIYCKKEERRITDRLYR